MVLVHTCAMSEPLPPSPLARWRSWSTTSELPVRVHGGGQWTPPDSLCRAKVVINMYRTTQSIAAIRRHFGPMSLCPANHCQFSSVLQSLQCAGLHLDSHHERYCPSDPKFSGAIRTGLVHRLVRGCAIWKSVYVICVRHEFTEGGAQRCMALKALAWG